jgi:hypothetical protein
MIAISYAKVIEIIKLFLFPLEGNSSLKKHNCLAHKIMLNLAQERCYTEYTATNYARPNQT